MVKFTRDGIRVWPYCEECGCRLNILTDNLLRTEVMLVHFSKGLRTDARGCVCGKRFSAKIVPLHKVAEFVT
jgi:hypothetical protein